MTAAGTFKPSFLIPNTFVNGCAENLKGKRVLFVDFQGLKGYSARQAASVVHKFFSDTSFLTIRIPEQGGDLIPIKIADLFEDGPFLEMVTTKIRSEIDQVDMIGFPAVCGIHDSRKIVQLLEKMIDRPCFEIPGLPPLIPGLKLKNAFEKNCHKMMCRY